jgi:hypothetical protein
MPYMRLPEERPPTGALTLQQFDEARARRGKGASVSGLTFPPLVANFNPSGSEASWPGAEYTRRTRLKTKLDPTHSLSTDFTKEMQDLLGANYAHWEDSMRPSAKPSINMGRPPTGGGGSKPIQPSYVLRRAETTDGTGAAVDLGSTTLSLSGHVSKSRANETSYTKFGPVPAYLFEDREKMANMDEWFEKYGRPTPNAINLGPRQLYTHYQNASKRCCGEPSNVQIMKKGFVTA